MISVTKEMKDALEEERKKRLLDSIPETIRMMLSEYLAKINKSEDINEVLQVAMKDYKAKGRR